MALHHMRAERALATIAALLLVGCNILPEKLDPKPLVGCSASSPQDCNRIDESSRFQTANIYSTDSAKGVGSLVAEKWTGAQLKQLVESGIAVSDLACHQWLTSLEHDDRNIGLGKDMLNVVANAASGLAGVNGASARSMAQAAIILGGVNAGVDVYRADVILGAIPAIKEKIAEAQKVAKGSLRTAIEELITGSGGTEYDRIESARYDQAKRLLLEYHYTCSAAKVKRLLETSLAEVAYVAADDALDETIKSSKASVMSAALRAGISGTRSGEPISVDTLYGLWLSTLAKQVPSDLLSAYTTVEVSALLEDLNELEATDSEAFRQQRSRLMTLGSQLDFQARYEKDKKAAAAAEKAAKDEAAKKEAEDVAEQAPDPSAKASARAILAQALEKRDLAPYRASIQALLPRADLAPLSNAIDESAAKAKSVEASTRGASLSKGLQRTLTVTPKLVSKRSLVE